MRSTWRKGSTAPAVIDLFAGAGLFSHAFACEGFNVRLAIEVDRIAAATYASQVGDHVRVADVRECVPEGPCDVLIAGPPCQGFSTLGKRNPNDSRNQLSLEVVRWARALRPSVVVIENVAAFLNAPIWKRLVDELESLGYEVSGQVVDACDFGVPQRRLRSFTFASRLGIPVLVPDRDVVTKTVRIAWEGLPEVPDGKNLHWAPEPSPLALERMRVIPPGGDKRDIMARRPDLAAPSWWRLACQVTDAWGRMEWDRPSNTLRTHLHPSKGRYIHPEQHRVISLREAARLHTIDDAWTFAGAPSAITRQIGNSVPPALGRAVARAVASVLN